MAQCALRRYHRQLSRLRRSADLATVVRLMCGHASRGYVRLPLYRVPIFCIPQNTVRQILLLQHQRTGQSPPVDAHFPDTTFGLGSRNLQSGFPGHNLQSGFPIPAIAIDRHGRKRYAMSLASMATDKSKSGVPSPTENAGANDEIEGGTRTGDLPKAVRQRLEAVIPEMVKKTFAAGLGAFLTTEEGIRRLTKDLSLPKDVAGYLATTAGNTKDEILRIIAREVREFLETVNLSEEVAKMLTTLSFEIKTEIRFIPNDEKYGSVKPDVSARVGLKRVDDRGRQRRRRRRRRRGEDLDAGDSVARGEANRSNDSGSDT